MAKPHTPHGGGHGDGPNPSRPHGEGDGDGSTPSGRRRSTTDVPENVSRAQETVAEEARQGRPGGEGEQGNPKPGDTEGDGSDTTSNADSPEAFINNIIDDPKSVAGKSAEEIAQEFNDAGYPATVQQSTKKGTSGNAVQVRIQGHPEITNIQVHPGGGRHTPDGSPYWKISTSTAGKIWVIPEDFRGAGDLNGNVVRYDE